MFPLYHVDLFFFIIIDEELMQVVRANSYANKYTEVAADQAPALPSKMGQLNLILKSKAEVPPDPRVT